jgi:hypothetical protein
VTLGEAVADAIAALGADEDKEAVVIFGGPLLLDGLLDAAATTSRSGRERAAAERALASLLATGANDALCCLTTKHRRRSFNSLHYGLWNGLHIYNMYMYIWLQYIVRCLAACTCCLRAVEGRGRGAKPCMLISFQGLCITKHIGQEGGAHPGFRTAGTTASAVLSRPGALPRLLAAAGHHACEALPGALRAGATMARLPGALSFDDLSALLAQVTVLPAQSLISPECAVHTA